MKIDDSKIEIFKKLQDFEIEYKFEIKLPRIVVIGSQSCGKSSVLEKIINRDILPKGNEITTRCPLLINLRKTCYEEYCEVNQHKELQLNDAKKVIMLEMKKICGNNKNIKENEIIINIYLRDTYEISLVDLPGLTKIPIEDQPKDIEAQIENLVMKYIKDENVLILAISAANVDLANSDSLRLSRKVDIIGTRTIGVITKIDLMDKLTNCLDILHNKKSKLKLGYVGMINRSQYDLNKQISLEDSYRNEDVFFSSHELYEALIPKIGTKYLTELLNLNFSRFLSHELPKIKNKIQEKINVLNDEIIKYNHENFSKADLIKSYTKTIKHMIKEKLIDNKIYSYKQEIKFMFEFNELFRKLMTEKTKMLDSNITNEIKTNNSFFVSEKIFKRIIQEQIENLHEKIFRCFENVCSLLVKHIRKIDSEVFRELTHRLADDIEKSLLSKLVQLKKNFKEYSDMQKSYINLNHPDFNKVEIMKKLYKDYVHDKKISNGCKNDFSILNNLFLSKREKTNEHYFILHENFEVDIIRSFSDSYFEISKKAIIDHAQKSAFFFLVLFVKNDVYKILLDKSITYKSNLFEKNKDVQAKFNTIRNELMKNLEIMKIFN